MSTPTNLPTPENYPASPAPIAEIFGFNKPKEHAHGNEEHAEAAPTTSSEAVVHSEHVSEVKPMPATSSLDQATSKPADSHSEPAHLSPIMEKIKAEKSHSSDSTPPLPTEVKVSVLRNITSTILPYVAIFAIGLFTYFYFFNKVDFGTIFKSTKKQVAVVSQKDTQMQALITQNRAAYDKWIAGFYYDISDAKVVDPNSDNSGNGLTNFQKFLLNLNPKSYSTLGVDASDTELLAQGVNPLSGNKLTDTQKTVLDKYIDVEVAMNKLTLARMQKQGQVAGTSTSNSSNYQGLQPRGPLNMNAAQASQIASMPQINPYELDIDQNTPGLIEIPSLKISAPLVWTKDPANFESDLLNGVVHYPGTAMPGEIGTSYISGHSSNYAWVKSSYNKIFSHIDEIPDFGSFQITVTLKNGKTAVLHYVVKNRQQFSPTDQAQFQNGGTSVVALSTCWPVGSTAKRYVVFGELSGVDK
jgi:LPXTG-site transpeptidase (sortase) family protein